MPNPFKWLSVEIEEELLIPNPVLYIFIYVCIFPLSKFFVFDALFYESEVWRFFLPFSYIASKWWKRKEASGDRIYRNFSQENFIEINNMKSEMESSKIPYEICFFTYFKFVFVIVYKIQEKRIQNVFLIWKSHKIEAYLRAPLHLFFASFWEFRCQQKPHELRELCPNVVCV